MSQEQKESSVLFSLNELFNLEQDRIKQEEAAKIQAAELARQAEEENRRRAIAAEEQRLREEEERKRAEEARQREEAARLEALRLAEIERARVTAEEQARLESMRQQQAHAQELAKITQDKKKKNLTILVAVAAFVLVLGGSLAGYALYSANKEAKEKDRIARLEQERKQQELEALQRKLEEQDKRVSNLMDSLANAKDEAAKAKIEAELASAQREQSNIRRSVGNINKGGKADTPKAPCTCAQGDPMCSCP